MRVLLVDDDNTLATLLASQLADRNYIVDCVSDGETGWAYASTFDYDLIVLDWMLPQLDGIRLCQRLRDHEYNTPILLLSVKGEQSDKVKGLEAGADDYVVKPFDIDELMARIRGLLRRSSQEVDLLLTWGQLSLNPSSCKVQYKEQLVSLTAKEYSLLELLLRHPHQVFSATTLLNKLWSSDDFPSEATVRSHLRRLRKKLHQSGAATDLIETVHGLGYRLKSLTAETSQATDTDRSNQRASRYLEGLTQTWRAHKGESIASWKTLLQIAETLQEKGITEQQQVQAVQIAHKLAGTLGTFGLMSGYRLSLQAEQLLLQLGSQPGTVSATQSAQLHAVITSLGHTLDELPSLVCPIDDPPASPGLLMVDVNSTAYIQQLMAMAIAQGLDTTVVASVEAASQRLSLESTQTAPALISQLPNVVLVNLVAGETNAVLDESITQKLLHFIERVAQCWPQVPVMVITPQADFGTRLDLIRRGGALILEYPLVPADVLTTIGEMLHVEAHPSKVMIVDDDAHYLKQVVQLLHPWNFEITPLTNPQRFWTLFNQVQPDLVVFDVEMPHISGFELAQVLRSYTQWQHLPIVFLSVHRDREKQDQAFALGADDYITKPIQGQTLAIRLLNRLKRIASGTRQPA